MATVESMPTTAKGRAARARIVAAASGLVFERGVAGTSLDDIGAAAGAGKSQMYHYFAEKSSLVHAVIGHQIDAVLDAQQPHLTRLDTWRAWRAWRDQLVDLQRQRQCRGGCPIGSLAAELADTDEVARTELADGFERWESAFRGGLSRMRDRGRLRADADVDRLALATLASVQGGLVLCQTRRDVAPLEVALDAAIAHLRSYRHEPRSA